MGTSQIGKTISRNLVVNSGVSYSDEYMYLAYLVQDDTPLQNSKTQGDLWNGDAVEMLFINPNANDKKNFLLLSVNILE